MGKCAADCLEDFLRMLPVEMERALKSVGYAYEKDLLPASNFGKAIDNLADSGQRCVILIDEYDDPVARTLKNPEEAEAVRGKLASLYGQLKTRTSALRFLMITGVSKFTKMSVFSTISNLIDLSFDDDYAAMLGYTESELDANFQEHIARHAGRQARLARRSFLRLEDPRTRRPLRRALRVNGLDVWKFGGLEVFGGGAHFATTSVCAVMEERFIESRKNCVPFACER